MDLFGFHSAGTNDDLVIDPTKGDGKIFKMTQLAAICMMIIAIALVVLQVFQLFSLGVTANGIVCSLGVIGLGGITALPWVRVFEVLDDKRFKITAIAFMAVIGVCVILWIVCVWQIIGIINDVIKGDGENILAQTASSLNVIRVSLIVSMQFLIGSYVTMNIVKYRKTLLLYQGIADAALLYIDFFAILLLTAFTITAEGDVEIGSSASFFVDHWQWLTALFVIALLLFIFPTTVFKRADRKKILQAKAAANSASAPQNAAQQAPAQQAGQATGPAPQPFYSSASPEPTVEEKLSNLKDLLDKGLITQDEYNAKRAEILNSI